MVGEDIFVWALEKNTKKFLLPVRAILFFHSALCVMGVCVCTYCQTAEITSQASRYFPSSTADANSVGSPSSQNRTAAGTTTAIPLTLKQAADLALRQNPTRVIARVLLNEAIQSKDITRAGLLPQANLAVREAIIRYNAQSILAPPLGLGPRPLRIGPYQSETGGATFSQQLVNLSLIREYQIGSEGVKTAKFDESSVRESIVAIVVADYLSVLQAFANEEAVTARVALAQRLYDQAVRVEKNGVGTAIDTLRAEVELQNEKQRLLDAETQHNVTVYALAQILDLPRGEEPQPTDAMQFFQLPSFDRQQLVSGALANRPEMQALLSRKHTAKLAYDAASEQRLPNLAFSGFYDYQARRLDTGEPGYTYAITLEMPLWTSGRIRADMERAHLEEDRLAQERQDLENIIEQQVKTALDQLEAGRSAVIVADLGLKLAQEEVARAERRFGAGVATNIDVITAQDQLARADDNQIHALYRFNQARADLARAEGDAEAIYAR